LPVQDRSHDRGAWSYGAELLDESRDRLDGKQPPSDAVVEDELELVSRQHDAEVDERSHGPSNRKTFDLGHVPF
jgi:hypothetical protein